MSDHDDTGLHFSSDEAQSPIELSFGTIDGVIPTRLGGSIAFCNRESMMKVIAIVGNQE